jgi:CheY-like chemotaxis protein
MHHHSPARPELKVLLVDDNARARAMLRDCLRGEAGEFCECEDGADALAAYAHFQPDWVLMDFEMRRMDGLTATRLILTQFPQAAILIVSNHDEQALRKEAREAGARGFVVKDDLLPLPALLRTTSVA